MQPPGRCIAQCHLTGSRVPRNRVDLDLRGRHPNQATASRSGQQRMNSANVLVRRLSRPGAGGLDGHTGVVNWTRA